MSEPLRSVGPRERALYLRTLPFADALKPEDVMMAALHMEERRFDPETRLLRSDEPIENMFILVEGAARLERDRARISTLEAPARAGLIGLLASDRGADTEATPPGDVVADTPVRALELSAKLMEQLLDTSFDFLYSLIRWVARQLLDEQPRSLLASACAALVTSTDAQLSLYDRVRWLHESTLFESTDLDAIFEVARRQKPRRLESGDVLWRAGDEPDSVYSLVRGCVEMGPDRGTEAAQRTASAQIQIGGQEFIGMLEALADREYTQTARADGRALALELGSDDLIDVLTDYGGMGADLLRKLAGWALEHRWRETDGGDAASVDELDKSDLDRRGDVRKDTVRLAAIE